MVRLVQLDPVTYTLVESNFSEITHVISKSNERAAILGDPGAASRYDAIFSGESLLHVYYFSP